MKKFVYIVAWVLSMSSCSERTMVEEQWQGPLPEGCIAAVAEDFVPGGAATRTVITQEGSSAPDFAWRNGDVIGVIPMDGKTVQSNYELKEVYQDSRKASFDGGVWSLKAGKEYAAYYPYVKVAAASGESVSVSFSGQTQSGNNSLAHLGAYDYMYAEPVPAVDGGTLFSFSHLVSLVRLQMTLPAGTYEKLTLSSEKEWFASEASLSLSTGVMTATGTSNVAVLQLENVTLPSSSVLTVWLSVLPTAVLDGQSLDIRIFGTGGSLSGTLSGLNAFEAGKVYSYSHNMVGDQGVEHGNVDLGLSVMWATCNVGASRPEESGDYFAWGETVPKSSYYNENYAFYHLMEVTTGGEDDGSGFVTTPVTIEKHTFDKYVPKSKAESIGYNGFYDNKTVLDPEDDAAHVNWGGKWRMPTETEWRELLNNCTWTEGSMNGVNGYKITSNRPGYTDRWIFLPRASYFVFNSIFEGYATGCGYYYASTLHASNYAIASVIRFHDGFLGLDRSERRTGMPVRPVWPADSDSGITGVSLPESVILVQGETGKSLTASLATDGRTQNDYVIWSSFDRSVVEVDENGRLAAVSAGSAQVSVQTVFGGFTAACLVTVIPEKVTGNDNGHGYVDLGLPSGLRWATMNVGAASCHEAGGYYQWAGTYDVSNTDINLGLDNCPYHKPGTDYGSGWTKYVTSSNPFMWSGEDNADNKTSLDIEDDAAHANWGGGWHMPTEENWAELYDSSNCIWIYTCIDGMYGYKVMSRRPNRTDRWIFIPDAGNRIGNILVKTGCYYWSPSLDSRSPESAFGIALERKCSRTSMSRHTGLPIRPVTYGR